MYKSFIYRWTSKETSMVTRVGDMETVLAGEVRFPAENLTIAKKIVFVTELSLLRSEWEKWLREKVGYNIHGISTGTPFVLVGNLGTLSSQIERTDGGLRCIFQRRSNAWFLCMSGDNDVLREHSQLAIRKQLPSHRQSSEDYLSKGRNEQMNAYIPHTEHRKWLSDHSR